MSTQIGRQAEDAAAAFLETEGYEIITQNWRTRWCEIDIVVRKDTTIYFVEVKYRGSQTWGSGLDYITPSKLQQMHFAAQFWVAHHNWRGDYRLSAVEATGDPPIVGDWLDDVS